MNDTHEEHLIFGGPTGPTGASPGLLRPVIQDDPTGERGAEGPPGEIDPESIGVTGSGFDPSMLGTDGSGDVLNADGNLADEPDTIYTFSGGKIRPLHPDPEAIDIRDIAHSLAGQCRFTGHTRRFYSVAEHSILVMRTVEDPRMRLTALLHDASEAYLADLARPIKKAPGLGEIYLQVEGVLEQAIASRFSLIYPYPPEVKAADDAMLAREIHSLMPTSLSDQWPEPDYRVPKVFCWDPERAEIEFLHEYKSLTASG